MNLTSEHIHDFIVSLPGGNVKQYAFLLSVSPNRLNTFLLNNKLGQKLVKAGLVCAPMKGMMPYWATEKTPRGVLTANNVPTNGPALARVLKTLPNNYHSDAVHIFKMVIQMAGGNIGFEDGLMELSAPYAHLATEHHAQQAQIAHLSKHVETLSIAASSAERLAASFEKMKLHLPAPITDPVEA